VAAPAPASPQKTSPSGLIYGGIGYFLWGISPIYFKLAGFVGALEMTAHRVVWSFLLLLALMPALGRLPALRQILASRRLRAVCCLTSFLLMWNWLLFVYVIESNQVLAGSLAYYMVPLWSVLLGRFFLKESVSRVQWAALALAGAGVLAAPVTIVPLIAFAAGQRRLSFAMMGLMQYIVYRADSAVPARRAALA